MRRGGYGGAKEAGGGEEKKNWGETDFFSNFDLAQCLESTLFIGRGRGTPCLYWCQILALDSNKKDLNCWFKVVIVNYQILTIQSYMSWPL